MRRRKILSKIGMFALTLPVLAFIYLPVLWLLTASISTRAELLTVPPHWIPQNPTLVNYLNIFLPGSSTSEVSRTIAITLLNSFKVASAVTVICLVVGGLAAYALVRVPFRYSRGILVGVLGTRMIPEISLVIPLFIVASHLSLIDKPSVLVITYLTFSLPFAIWLMASFFQSIPVELEDAARIDGCSRLEILWRIVMPISAPGLVSTGLFVFLLSWDEFFYALIFTSTLASKTAPVAISEFVGRYVTDITAMMAGGVLAAIPPVLLALIFQRYIVSGITAGAVKG
ncbi:MAG: carbohydrate transporter permease [Chloroflexi bacterium]|jgi:multiple sugar transport system permease protein|nr:carbohydrate transporter permease [Chloroflexota bacterium]